MDETIKAIKYLMENGCSKIPAGCEGCPLKTKRDDDKKPMLCDALFIIKAFPDIKK